MTVVRLTNVDQVPLVHDILNQDTAGRVGVVALRPVFTQSECFVFPCQEADALHNGRLHDFFTRENTPRNSIGAFRRRVGAQLARLGHGVVRNVRVVVNARETGPTSAVRRPSGAPRDGEDRRGSASRIVTFGSAAPDRDPGRLGFVQVRRRCGEALAIRLNRAAAGTYEAGNERTDAVPRAKAENKANET